MCDVVNSIKKKSANKNIIDESVKIPKKRGRKPKGGKIIETVVPNETNNNNSTPNVILHLKCGSNELKNIELFSSPSYTYDGEKNNNNGGDKIVAYQFNDGDRNFGIVEQPIIKPSSEPVECKDEHDIDTASIYQKLKLLSNDLHTNNLSDKRSACFWCTYEFDNPPIYVPKHVINGSYTVYGCFCSPECAAGHLFKQSDIDSSSKFERYALLNHIYCKIYNYNKNIKPAPYPRYTLNKFFGNLSIQEYRHLLKNERLLLVVDKPLVRSLPELHIDNDDFVINNRNAGGKFKLKTRDNKQTKSEILSNKFNMR